nr:hypothetical protein [Tanacetum cinerariifolium]
MIQDEPDSGRKCFEIRDAQSPSLEALSLTDSYTRLAIIVLSVTCVSGGGALNVIPLYVEIAGTLRIAAGSGGQDWGRGHDLSFRYA